MDSKQTSEELMFICLKYGITYQSIQVNRLDPNVLNEIYQEADKFVSRVVGRLESHDQQHHIKLFLISADHQPPSLKLITRANELSPACFIEIIIWRSDPDPVIITREHELVEQTYKRPTYCSACDYFIWGLVRQGKKCRVCHRKFHHQCAEHLLPDCPGVRFKHGALGKQDSSSTTYSANLSQAELFIDGDVMSVTTPKKKTRFGKFFGGTLSKNSSNASNGTKLSNTSPAQSNSSSSMSLNVPTSKAGSLSPQRRKSPSSSSMKDIAEVPPSSSKSKRSDRPTSESSTTTLPRATEFPTIQINPSNVDARQDRRPDVKLTNCQEKDGVWTATGQFGRESRRSKRTDITYDKKQFKFVQRNEQGNEYSYEIPVSAIQDKSNIDGILSSNGNSGISSAQAVAYHKLASLLLTTIKEATHSKNEKTSKSILQERSGTANTNRQFNDLYEVNEREILGMGRFGIVFGGTMRRNGVRVAIKKIQTAQCTEKERENIEHEAKYLLDLNHPGILKFEGIFEFDQHILLVTERLDIDMLNYILNNTNPKARLTEDMTRFLAFQLVAAIRYLHFKNIAHCDLKPDNVLINIFNDEIVHLKVGDFGYARQIRDDSIRYTKVGTPAYLPPEVSHDEWRHQRGYNKTVDMWAIGVIIFVSLTGYFPFNEDEDILPQLKNISKLFQEEAFSHVTEDVKDLLKLRLMVTDAGHRMHSAGVIYHDWFQKSKHLFQSCKQLEECLAKKWLTLFFEEHDLTLDNLHVYEEDSDSN